MIDNAKQSQQPPDADLSDLPEGGSNAEDFLWGADHGGRQSDAPQAGGADLSDLPEDESNAEDFLWGADHGGRQSDAPQAGGAGGLNSANEDADLGDACSPGRSLDKPSDFPEKTAETSPGDEKKEADRVRAESLNILGKVGNFGLFLLIAIIFGYFIGDQLDSFFGTKPVFAVFWIGCAVIASFRELWRSVREAKRIGDGN